MYTCQSIEIIIATDSAARFVHSSVHLSVRPSLSLSNLISSDLSLHCSPMKAMTPNDHNVPNISYFCHFKLNRIVIGIKVRWNCMLQDDTLYYAKYLCNMYISYYTYPAASICFENWRSCVLKVQ